MSNPQERFRQLLQRIDPEGIFGPYSTGNYGSHDMGNYGNYTDSGGGLSDGTQPPRDADSDEDPYGDYRSSEPKYIGEPEEMEYRCRECGKMSTDPSNVCGRCEDERKEMYRNYESIKDLMDRAHGSQDNDLDNYGDEELRMDPEIDDEYPEPDHPSHIQKPTGPDHENFYRNRRGWLDEPEENIRISELDNRHYIDYLGRVDREMDDEYYGREEDYWKDNPTARKKYPHAQDKLTSRGEKGWGDYWVDNVPPSSNEIKLSEFIPGASGETTWLDKNGRWGSKNRESGETRYFNNKIDANKWRMGDVGHDTELGAATSGGTMDESANLLERNYRKEYDNYQGTPEQKKRRAQRNKDRRNALRTGRVKKGDGNDIHHKDGNPFNHSDENKAVMHKSRNRSMNKAVTKEDHVDGNEPFKSKLKLLITKALYNHLENKKRL